MTEFYWQLPVAGDNRSAAFDQLGRKARPTPNATIRDLRRNQFNNFDYLSQIARAAELAGFDGLSIPDDVEGESSWIVAGAIAREVRRPRLVIEFSPGLGSAVYAAKQAVTSGLDDSYDGVITLDGQRVAGTSLERGLVFQDHRLFPWMTLEQNVALALTNRPLSKAAKAKLVAEHIALVGLKGFEKAWPHQLSGGMAQRAAIARALVNEPKVLLLDEPFGALDALTRVHLQTELQRIWLSSGATMIMITHDVEEAIYLGDRVVVMQANPGRIVHTVDVALTHPRDRASPILHRLKDEILAELTNPPVETSSVVQLRKDQE